jgi:hypothetical protein
MDFHATRMIARFAMAVMILWAQRSSWVWLYEECSKTDWEDLFPTIGKALSLLNLFLI